jgi:hypothetical protein
MKSVVGERFNTVAGVNQKIERTVGFRVRPVARKPAYAATRATTYSTLKPARGKLAATLQWPVLGFASGRHFETSPCDAATST